MTLIIWTLLALSPVHAKTVASINNVTISDKELDALYQQNQALYPGRSVSKKDFLEDLISREVAVQEAQKLKLEKTPAVREQIRSVLFQAALEHGIGEQVAKIRVTDAEAKAFYAKNPEIRISHIFVPISAGAGTAEVQAAAQKIREIKSRYVDPGKMSFTEVAQRFSFGPEAPMGGDLDYRTRDQLEPAIYDAAIRLSSIGSVSAPIRSSAGYHLLRLTGKRSWKEANQARIKRLVFEEKRDELVKQYLSNIKKKAKIIRSL